MPTTEMDYHRMTPSSLLDIRPSYDPSHWGTYNEENIGIVYELPQYIWLQQSISEDYHLNVEEQKVFRLALRKSVEIIKKA